PLPSFTIFPYTTLFRSRVNGLTGLCLGMLDVLGGLDTLRICTSYRIDGKSTRDLPCDLTHCTKLEPVYEDLPGWREDISDARSRSEEHTSELQSPDHIV